MNSKSKKKLMNIQLKKFKEKQIDLPTIIKILDYYKSKNVSLSHIIDK